MLDVTNLTESSIMGWHVPRLAFLPCKERVESSILFRSTMITCYIISLIVACVFTLTIMRWRKYDFEEFGILTIITILPVINTIYCLEILGIIFKGD